MWFPCLKHFNHCYNSFQTSEHKTLSHNLLNHVDHLISNHQNFMDAVIHKDDFSSKRKRLPDELEMNRLGTVTKHIISITKYSTKEAIFQCDNYPELSRYSHVNWELREEGFSSSMTGLRIAHGSDARAQEEKASEFIQ